MQVNSTEHESIIKLLNQILHTAIEKNASDIHFEIYQNQFRVRLRIDGVLYVANEYDINLAASCISRLKIMANLNIAEKRLPQDGRFTFIADNNEQRDCRVSSCPTVFGEKIAVRLLSAQSTSLAIDQLGLDAKQMALLTSHLKTPQGMILVTGPTGSGKTVTLYSIINQLNSTDKNISTIEDPVEINLFGINQVEAHPKIGLSFAVALRTFLRQDPDIIMLGEIRDTETAEVAIKAAQTGHLVLSTLHTNSAHETLNRLLNMNIPAFNLASSITLIIAQRLVRKLCEHCKEAVKLPKHILLEVGFHADSAGAKLYRARGCSRCVSGYKGRIGVFEILANSPHVANMIMQYTKQARITKPCTINFATLRQAALEKVASGITSLEEVNRVIAL